MACLSEAFLFTYIKCISERSSNKKRAHDSTISENAAADNDAANEKTSNEEEVDDGEVNVLQGTGRLTSSGTAIQGHYTEFMNQLTPGDAIIIVHPTRFSFEFII